MADADNSTRKRFWLGAIAGAIGALAIVVAIGGAYVLGTRTTAAPGPPPVLTPTTSVTTTTAGVPDGPQLLEANGNPLPSDVVEQVRNVYSALKSNDTASIRVAFAAAGSDDGNNSEAHLGQSSVNAALIAALRTFPFPQGNNYRYKNGSYALSFVGAVPGSTRAGLDEIDGPWAPPVVTSTSAPDLSNSTNVPFDPSTITRLPGESVDSCVRRGGNNANCGVSHY